MSKRRAYIRVSSIGQSTSRQDQQIEELNVDKIFREKISGKNIQDRPQFQSMLDYAREDDHIYCADLTRWGRSLIDIKTTISDLTKRQVTVTFLKENLTFTGNDDPMSNLLSSSQGRWKELRLLKKWEFIGRDVDVNQNSQINRSRKSRRKFLLVRLVLLLQKNTGLVDRLSTC
jgi:hypothetical protein